jgi:predicted ribosome quality control (RQC) complex YloA/Tae2 family protein
MSEDKDKYAHLQLRELFIRQLDKMDRLETKFAEIEKKQQQLEQSLEVESQVQQALEKLEQQNKKQANTRVGWYIAIGSFLVSGLFKVVEVIYNAITTKP